MHPIDDPSALTPEERLHELAGILARGYRRWLRTEAALASVAGDCKANGAQGLDSYADQSVNRTTARESERGGGAVCPLT